ncbi:MAG: hypothetical protein IJI71_10950 [Clostridia bacterium]|nr:hypothetical protein [Clostridia bacterium]
MSIITKQFQPLTDEGRVWDFMVEVYDENRSNGVPPTVLRIRSRLGLAGQELPVYGSAVAGWGQNRGFRILRKPLHRRVREPATRLRGPG